MSELADLRGVLRQSNLNSVQEAMLGVVIQRKRDEEAEIELAKFEQNLFINNPALYKEYTNKKKQEEIDGNKDIQWLAPSSIEEAAELMDMFKDIDNQLKEMDEKPATVSSPAPQVDFLGVLQGINLDEIGGDE